MPFSTLLLAVLLPVLGSGKVDHLTLLVTKLNFTESLATHTGHFRAGQTLIFELVVSVVEERTVRGGWQEVNRPRVDLSESANVTGLLGKTAVLNCRVRNIGNRTTRDSPHDTQGSDDWLLMIHYLQHRDEGLYECQISTTPPTSHFIHLSVVDVYINTGSRLSLTCSVKYSPQPPAFIFWYHDDK
ncbi:hypothetical protein Hamer_G017093, partial [Homarus americanus]